MPMGRAGTATGVFRAAASRSIMEEAQSRAHQEAPGLPPGSSTGAPRATGTGATYSAIDWMTNLSGASTEQPQISPQTTASDLGMPRRRGRRASVGSVGSVDSMLSLPKSLATRIMESPGFDACIGLVILGNAVAIGAEQSLDLAGNDISAFAALEHIFLLVYVLELLIRCVATGCKCLSDNWVRVDVFLVGTGVVCFWVIFPLLGDVEELEPLNMLRMLRLLRLARAVRLIGLFRELWMLVQGLLVSARTMVYTIGLIAGILYLFSVVAIELITNHDLAEPESGDLVFQGIVANSFHNLPQTMMTLMQFVSFDNVVLIYEPLVKRDWRLALFFISVIVIVGILLMNLVTAVVVNSALEQAMADKELEKRQEENQKRKTCKELRKLFIRLDEDRSGQVTMEEIGNITEEDKQTLTRMLGVSDPMELFRALDVDGSGEVDIEEFCNGIWQVCISKAPIEIKRVEKMVEAMRHQLRMSESVMADMVKEMRDQFDEKLRLAVANVCPSEPAVAPGTAGPGGHGDAGGRPALLSPAGSAQRGSSKSSSSAAWGQAPLLAEVQADCDGQLARGIQACVREAVREVLSDLQPSGAVTVAVHGGFGAGAAGSKDARLGCRQQAGEVPSLGSDISTAPGWVEELTFELRSLRATGVKVALSEEALAGSKAPAPEGAHALTADLMRALTRASRLPSKESKGAEASVGGPARRRAEPPPAGGAAGLGARRPRAPALGAAPRRPAGEPAGGPSRRPAPPRGPPPARAPEAAPPEGAAPAPEASAAAASAGGPAAGAGAAAPPPGRVALARGSPAGPAEVHHL